MAIDTDRIDDEDTFEYDKDQEEIPFAMVPHELIRNKSLSTDCRMLIIFLLSNTRDWQIRVSQLRESFENGLGRNKLYRIIREAMNSGYLSREIIRDPQNRKFKKFKYFVYSKPRLKECLPRTGFREMQIGYTKEEHISSSSSSLRSEEKEEESEEKKPSAAPPVPTDAGRLSSLFLSKLREESPNLKAPNVKKWEYHFDLMIRRDKRSVVEIEELIEWWRNSWWYLNGARSPEKFRAKFDTMQAQMRSKKFQDCVGINRKFCETKPHPKMAGMLLFQDHVVNKHTQKDLTLRMDPGEFRFRLYELFEIFDALNGAFCVLKKNKHPEMEAMLLYHDEVYNKNTKQSLKLQMEMREFRFKFYELFGLVYDPEKDGGSNH